MKGGISKSIPNCPVESIRKMQFRYIDSRPFDENKYDQEIEAWEGFHVSNWSEDINSPEPMFVQRDISCEYTKGAARFAVEEHNKDQAP
ncbi:hypothetical protein PanWU01x14_352890 [Parasponia andersonii]|uniref:Uncharacterized protein n=1 Tax=Parasponia andersonii TaxID=3476 RepID=A0A2P5AA54_PARAD|nr:hypothetical protein PanWU01x14_352890 [Parasponia andersonii]